MTNAHFRDGNLSQWRSYNQSATSTACQLLAQLASHLYAFFHEESAVQDNPSDEEEISDGISNARNQTVSQVCSQPRKVNPIADALSRLQAKKFRKLAPNAEDIPVSVPQYI